MRMRFAVALLMLAMAPAAWALDDAKEKPKEPTPLEKDVTQVISDHQNAVSDYYKQYSEKLNDKNTTGEERQKIYSGVPKADKVVAQLIELADKGAKDDPGTLSALTGILNYAGNDAAGQKIQLNAVERIARDFAENEKIGDSVMGLVYKPLPQVEDLLKAVIEKNSKKEARGKATYALGQFVKRKLEMAEMLTNPEQAKELEGYASADMIAQLQKLNKEQTKKEIEKLFETVSVKYPDVEWYKNFRTKKSVLLGEKAEGELYEIRHLAIGMAAPEIEHEDLDGKGLKLSDYKGKVVMLDFWGNW